MRRAAMSALSRSAWYWGRLNMAKFILHGFEELHLGRGQLDGEVYAGPLGTAPATKSEARPERDP